MPNLSPQLVLDRCPQCNVHAPSLNSLNTYETTNSNRGNPRVWMVYKCNSCGGLVTAFALTHNAVVQKIYPASTSLADDIPNRAREYLKQTIESLSAPVGAVMLAASAVDAMLRTKGLAAGTLYSRIDEAAATHLITSEMARWAHQVRLDAIAPYDAARDGERDPERITHDCGTARVSVVHRHAGDQLAGQQLVDTGQQDLQDEDESRISYSRSDVHVRRVQSDVDAGGVSREKLQNKLCPRQSNVGITKEGDLRLVRYHQARGQLRDNRDM